MLLITSIFIKKKIICSKNTKPNHIINSIGLKFHLAHFCIRKITLFFDSEAFF
jgi:hypothetical protein